MFNVMVMHYICLSHHVRDMCIQKPQESNLVIQKVTAELAINWQIDVVAVAPLQIAALLNQVGASSSWVKRFILASLCWLDLSNFNYQTPVFDY